MNLMLMLGRVSDIRRDSGCRPLNLGALLKKKATVLAAFFVHSFIRISTGASLKPWSLEDPQTSNRFERTRARREQRGSEFAPLDYFFTMSAITLLVGSTITRSWSTIA
jgi:hypothetical protein